MIAMTEVGWVLTCGTIGAIAIWVGHRIGYSRGLEDGKLSISASVSFERGRRAGQRETAAYLAASEIPYVRSVGRSLQTEWRGR